MQKNKKTKLIIYIAVPAAVLSLAVIAMFAFGVLKPPAKPLAAATPAPTVKEADTPTGLLPTPVISPSPTPYIPQNTPIPGVTLGKPLNRPDTRYEMALRLYDDYRRISGIMRVNYVNTTPDQLYELVFHLPANAFLKPTSLGTTNEESSYLRFFEKGGNIISSVSLNGELAFFTLSDDEMLLNIPLTKEINPGESVDVDIEFMLDVPQKNSRYGRSELGYQLGNCWPILAVYQDGAFVTDGYTAGGDPFYSDVGDYAVAFSFPAVYDIGATGNIIDTQTLQGEKTVTVAGKDLREFACMLTLNMQKGEETHNGTIINAHALSDNSVNSIISLTKKALTYYEKILGPFPYDTLTITQAELYKGGGMEYPGLVFMQRSLFLPANENHLVLTINHEIAHQWFYGVVGNDQINAPWIDEAICSYLSFLPIADDEDKKPYYNLWSYYIEERSKLGTVIDAPLSFYDDDSFANSVYWRGAKMYNDLREKIGDIAFFEGLAVYLQENAYKIATKDDVIRAFESASLQSLAGWFDDYLKSPEEITQ